MPNPVVSDSEPLADCGSDRPLRYRWEQRLKNTGGTRITLTERINYLNGGEFSKSTGFTINIDPGQTHTQPTGICSSVNAEQSFRTDWSGSEAGGGKIAVTGPLVRLMPK